MHQQNSPLLSSLKPPAWQVEPQHPSPDVFIINPLDVFEASQSGSDVHLPDSNCLTPNENLDIFISAASSSASCLILYLIGMNERILLTPTFDQQRQSLTLLIDPQTSHK